MFVCVLKNISLWVVGEGDKPSVFIWFFVCSGVICVCMCSGNRSVLLQNQSQRVALSVCECVLCAYQILISHLRYAFIFLRYFSSGTFYRSPFWISFQRRHREAKAKRWNRISRRMSHFVIWFCFSPRSMLLVLLSRSFSWFPNRILMFTFAFASGKFSLRCVCLYILVVLFRFSVLLLSI